MPPPRTLRRGGIFIGKTEKIIDKKCCIAYYWYIAQWKNRRVLPPSPLGERPFRGGEGIENRLILWEDLQMSAHPVQ